MSSTHRLRPCWKPWSGSGSAGERRSYSLNFVLDCDLLILDDLGAEFSTNFSVSVIYNIINSRLVEGKPTIISSNLTAKELEARYSPRVVSRIMGGYYTIPFLGNDIRILKR